MASFRFEIADELGQQEESDSESHFRQHGGVDRGELACRYIRGTERSVAENQGGFR